MKRIIALCCLCTLASISYASDGTYKPGICLYDPPKIKEIKIGSVEFQAYKRTYLKEEILLKGQVSPRTLDQQIDRVLSACQDEAYAQGDERTKYQDSVEGVLYALTEHRTLRALVAEYDRQKSVAIASAVITQDSNKK